MRKTLEVINELKEEGLIKDYVVGGGIAALFYIEPFLTYDLDISTILPEEFQRKEIIPLAPSLIFSKKEDILSKANILL